MGPSDRSASAVDSQIRQIVADYLERVGRGESVDREAILAAHAPIRDQLRARLDELDAAPAAGAQPTLAEDPSRDGDSSRPGSIDETVHLKTTAGNADDATVAGKTDFSRPTFAAGSRFADFELLAPIARGGMGVVYKARQVSLNRVVALKMILAGNLASERDVQRFRTEAEAAANLQHPNIVSVHEVGEHDGQHFFSMDFVEGQSLADLVRENPLSADRAAAYMQTIAEAIHYAHQQGTLHRDLKPSNVLIDANDQPRVTDFGVAKRLDGDSQLTATGTVLGTPSYMPPEQAAGRAAHVGPASDVYSLGAMLYELLTSRPPFRAETPLDTMLQVLNEEPVSPRMLNPKVPQDLETVCLKCLQKDPARRYATAGELAADLARWRNGEPILARPVGRAERLVRWCRRNPLVASLTTAVIVAFVIGFVGVTYQWRQTEAARARTETQRQLVEDALFREEAAKVERALAQVDALLNASPGSIALVVDSLAPFRGDVVPRLRELMASAELDDAQRRRVSLALLPDDPSQIDFLREQLLNTEPAELLPVRDALWPHRDRLVDDLWTVLAADAEPGVRRFRAALVLATYDPQPADADNNRWRDAAPFVASELVNQIVANPSHYEPLVNALQPVRQALIGPLGDVFRDANQPESDRSIATNILASYAADQPEALARLIVDADARGFATLMPRLATFGPSAAAVLLGEADSSAADDAPDADKDLAAGRQANAIIALARLDESGPLWKGLAAAPDPRLRSYLIDRLATFGTDPQLLAARLEDEPDAGVRRATLLALGRMRVEAVPAETRDAVVGRATAIAAADPDPGAHSAAEWLLRRWKIDSSLDQATGDSQPPLAGDDRRWFIDRQGHTMAVVRGPVEFEMGSPGGEPDRSIAEFQHPVHIGRSFAIATKEVTIEQFERFSRQAGVAMPRYTKSHSPDADGPIIMVAWYAAAQYCRWLSEQEGIAEDQMCYPPINEIKNGMQPVSDYLSRTGYRLPTESEWEYACRAGTVTSRYYGNSEPLLDAYAWHVGNSQNRAWPAGMLMPNDLGLFDMHGNAWEWCQEAWISYFTRPRRGGMAYDVEDTRPVDQDRSRVLRGGSFDSRPRAVRSAYHDRFDKPTLFSDEIGFRVARTLSE